MKLNKNEAYSLMGKILNNWCIRENALENIEEWVDDYHRECGFEIFTKALAWEKGTSYKDRKDFSKTFYYYDREYLKQHNLEDEMVDFEDYHSMVLQVVKEILTDFMDVDLKILEAPVQSRMVEKKQDYWVCPSCNKENTNTYRVSPQGNKCHHCNVVVKLL